MGNHAVAIHKKPDVGFVKPLVLSFSVSRYPCSTFGEYIKKARLEKDLKQTDVAKAINVDEMTIVNWERYDTIPLRNHDKIEKLCATLKLDYKSVALTFPYCAALS